MVYYHIGKLRRKKLRGEKFMIPKKISKALAWLLIFCCISLCIDADATSFDDRSKRYDIAINELKNYLYGYEMASPIDSIYMSFEELGFYKLSPAFKLYVQVLRDIEANEFGNIQICIDQMNIYTEFAQFLVEDEDLGTLEELWYYACGRQAEINADVEAAIGFYNKCLSFRDSFTRSYLLGEDYREYLYSEAIRLYSLGTYENIVTAYQLFEKLNYYKDSAEYAKKAYDEIMSIRYNEAVMLYENGDYNTAYELFFEMADYKDSMAYKSSAYDMIQKQNKYDKAIGLYNSGSYDSMQKAYDLFSELGSFKDSIAYKNAAYDMIQKQNKYDEAIRLFNNGSYDSVQKAYNIFSDLNGYKDSGSYKQKAYNELQRQQKLNTYNRAINLYNTYSYSDIAEAYNLFSELGSFEDSSSYKQYALDKLRKQEKYDSAMDLYDSNRHSDVQNAYNLFRELGNYNDSSNYAQWAYSKMKSLETPTPAPATPKPITAQRVSSMSGRSISRSQVSANASSTKPTGDYGPYYASMANDGKDKTEWVEGAIDNGSGEWIQFNFPRQQVIGFAIKAGMFRSKESFNRNSRPRTIIIHVSGAQPISVTLDDVMKEQYVKFSSPVTTDYLRIELSTFYTEGVNSAKGRDTCIADVTILAY